MPDPQDPANPAQNPAPAPATPPAAPAQPAADPTPPAPAADPAPAPVADPANPAPADPAANPTPGEGGGEPAAPQQTRQERRNQEREQRGNPPAINDLAGNFQPQVPQPNQPGAPVQQPPQGPQGFDIRQFADPEGNIDENAVNQAMQQNVVQAASTIANLQVQRQLDHRDAVNNFHQDTAALKSIPELNADPDNDAYIPELDEAIAAEYQARAFKVVGMDPNTNQPIRQLDTTVRLNEIAERHLRAAQAAAARSSASTNAAVAATADQGAPRPAGAPPAERPFESLSREEMRARLGVHKA